MRILEHRESHVVKLDDGSVWQIFPGDIDRTLAWLPTTELRLFEINDEIASHALLSVDDGTRAPGGRPLARGEGEEYSETRVMTKYDTDASLRGAAATKQSIVLPGVGLLCSRSQRYRQPDLPSCPVPGRKIFRFFIW